MASTPRCSRTKARTTSPTVWTSILATERPSFAPTSSKVTSLPTPRPGMTGNGPSRLVAAPERGSTNASTLPCPACSRARWKFSHATRLGRVESTSSTRAWELLM